MGASSKNTFSISGDEVLISHPDWDFIAHTNIRDDYKEELMSVTWSKKGEYLYNEKLGGYLHIYIMKKWYGEEMYKMMKEDGYVVDHMDNNGRNCRINNLAFLINDENKAKGMTVDKMSKEKSHIALSLYKDFSTQLFQITIVFNYPARAVISNLDNPAVIRIAYLLYNSKYEIVINDARQILYDYREDYSFNPENLHNIDYDIEGEYGVACDVSMYNKYLEGGHVFYFTKKAPIPNWTIESKKKHFALLGTPQ